MSEYKEVTIDDILAVIKKKKGRRDIKIVQKAYEYAKEKHVTKKENLGNHILFIQFKLHIHLQI